METKYPKMKVDRLKRLRKELRSLRENDHKRFNMMHWLEIEVESDEPTIKFKNGKCVVEPVTPICRTSACALGTAATIPEFNRAGLRLELDGTSGQVIYRGAEGTSAAEKFFGLTENESAYLFLPNRYAIPHGGKITTNHVIAHIDHVLEGVLRS